jgi:hypothetical protein
MIDVSNPVNKMSDHLLMGMHLFNPVIDPSGFLHWTRKLFGSITEKHPPVFTSNFSKYVCKSLLM